MIDINTLIEDTLVDETILDYLTEGGTLGISTDVRQAETRVQYEVLKALSGGSNPLVMKLIAKYGGIFRKAIKEFRKAGKVPTEEELLNYTSNVLGDDIYNQVEELKNSLAVN